MSETRTSLFKEPQEFNLPEPFCARVGIFTLPLIEDKFGKADTWGFMGTEDNDDNRVFIVSDPIERGRLICVHLAIGTQLLSWIDKAHVFDVAKPKIGVFTSRQPANISPQWSHVVFLGEERWRRFINRDESIKAELLKIIQLTRRCVESQDDDDKNVYDADAMLEDCDVIMKTDIKF